MSQEPIYDEEGAAQVIDAARDVLRTLGRAIAFGDGDREYVDEFIFIYEAYSNFHIDLWVTDEDNVCVFSQQGRRSKTVTRFRPGLWMQHLMEKAKLAAKIEAEKSKQREDYAASAFEPIDDMAIFREGRNPRILRAAPSTPSLADQLADLIRQLVDEG